jgi:SAM-dependent methyltransferase
MFHHIYKILRSKNPNLILMKLTIILAVILVLVLLYRVSEPPKPQVEGFQQREPFVLKTDKYIYDPIYVELYDGVNNTDTRSDKELIEIIKMSEPSSQNSIFLDVGSGTGYVVNQLREAGYNVFGIDKSTAMVNYAEKLYPESEYQCGDVTDSMTYEKGTFTHILCTHFTIYEIEDKRTFFSNCYYWSVPNSYLIVHLVDKNKFNIEPPNANKKPTLFQWPTAVTRETNTKVDFADFIYSASYDFSKGKNSSVVVFKETFTDKETKNVRQNENSLYMESIDNIVGIANNVGYIVHAKINLETCNGDPNQYLYVFERLM